MTSDTWIQFVLYKGTVYSLKQNNKTLTFLCAMCIRNWGDVYRHKHTQTFRN